MPGNEGGDRVHNFFAQDNLSQGQRHSQVVDGSWPVPINNPWAGSQRHIGSPSFNSKNYNLQQSDIERATSSHSFPVSHGLNFTQSTLRPENSRSQSQIQHANLNGYMHGQQIFQTRQNEENFLGVDTESDRHNMTSRGLSISQSQQGNGLENTASVRLESSESPVSFDFFGSQQQMSGQQTGVLQSLQQQQSGFHDMQLLKQQVLIRKMQELQRQQQLQQLEARQRNPQSQIPSITKQASGSHSPVLNNGSSFSPISEASSYPWVAEPTAGNTSWLQRATPAIQGSSNGFRISPEQGQALSLMGLVPEQVDQSLYGVPMSNTRGTLHHYSHSLLDKPSMQQMAMHSNSYPGNRYTGVSDQVNMQDGSLVSRQGFQGENLFVHASGQGLNHAMNLENLQQVNSLQRNAPLQDFRGSQQLAGPSETLQTSSSQNAVALDPTEEKILFGDDNIWDAFGSSGNTGAGGFSLPNGTGLLNGFPSVQSGSWSALMQSAVAETSSNGIGPQDGVSFHNTEVPAGNCQPATYEASMKQQTVLPDNLHTVSTLSSGSVPLSHDAYANNSYEGVPGFQQSGHKFSRDYGERLQIDSTCRSIQQPSEEGSKRLSCSSLQKSPAERSLIYGNAAHSLDRDMNVKSISGSWADQQSISSYNSGQPHNKQNNCNADETVSPSGDAVSKIHGNENKLQQLHSNNQKKMMPEEMSHGGRRRKADSGPNSSVGLEHVKSDMGSPQVNREDSSLNNLGVIPNSNTVRASQETSQLFPNSYHPSHWKHANSSMKSKGTEDSGKFQHNLNNGPQVFESSMNSSDKDAVKMHGTENCDRKENCRDIHRSNLSQHSYAGGLRENVWSDGSDSQNLPGGKHMLSGQADRRTTGPHKFQHHPTQKLDEDIESSYGMKHGTNSQVMSQQIPRESYGHNQGYFGQANFFGQFPKTSTEMKKGHSPDLQGNERGEDDAPSRRTLPGSSSNISTFDNSVSMYPPNKVAQSSQNMLELLHKVDQYTERGSSDGSVGPLQQNQSSASQGFGLQLAPPSQWVPVQNRALASLGSAQSVSSLSSCQITPEIREKGHHTWLASTAQVQSLPSSHETSQGEFKMNKFGMPGQTGNEASRCGMSGNISSALTSGFPNSISHFQNQQVIDASGKVTTNPPMNVSFDRHTSHSQQTDDCTSGALTSQSTPASLPDTAGISPHDKPVSTGDTTQRTDTNHSRESVYAPQISVGQALLSSQPVIYSGTCQRGTFPRMLSNVWPNVPGQQHLFGAQPHKFPLKIFQPKQSNNNVVSTSSTLQDQKEEDARKVGNDPSEFGVNSMNLQGFVCGEVQPAKESFRQLASSGNTDSAEEMGVSQGTESVAKNVSDASPSNSASTQQEIEAFGRSLKPNNLLHQNYSLLNQMQAMKSSEVDPSNRGLKRLKGADGGLGFQTTFKVGHSSEHNNMGGDSLVPRGATPSGDSKMLSFTGPVDNWAKNSSSQVGNVPSQDVLALGQKDSENYSDSNSTASVRVENSQISSQMAPPWLNQFGTFKNGQILQMYDAQKNATVKTTEQPFSLGKFSDSLHARNSPGKENVVADSNQVGNLWQRSMTPSVAIEHFSYAQSLVQNVTDRSLVVVRPKKRKSATSELVPWHKDVTQGSRSLMTISMAEVDWAKAANRLIDKVEDEAEMIEDGPPILRPKKRLILTTHLMQHVLRPPPTIVLSADASSAYETVAYMVARLALGNACSLIPCSGSDSCVPLDSSNLLSNKRKTSERIGDQHLSKVMEDYIGRAKKLENDFVRFDKRASVVDLRIEIQDLEKFSVINRFAKFHGRGQADGAETSSSSDAVASAQRPLPQRYVNVLPMPMNLPDRVQCLSL